MPPQHRCRLHDADRIQERGTQPIKPNEDQSVHGCEPKSRWSGPSQHIQLVPENHHLGLKPSPGLEQRDQEVRYQPQASDHSISDYPIYPRHPARIKFPIGTAPSTALAKPPSGTNMQKGGVFEEAPMRILTLALSLLIASSLTTAGEAQQYGAPGYGGPGYGAPGASAYGGGWGGGWGGGHGGFGGGGRGGGGHGR